MRITLIFLLLLLSKISFSNPNLNISDTNSKITLKTKIIIRDCEGCNLDNNNEELDRQIKNYQFDNRNWTTHIYPIATLILSFLTVIGVFFTIRKQSMVAKEDRDQLSAKWEHEVRERQKEQAEIITKNENEKENQRLKDKITLDSNIMDDLMKYLKNDKGTVSEATYFSMSLKSVLNIEGYPDKFKNIKSGILRILTDFFCFDAEYFSKPHHAYLQNQMLRNIPEYVDQIKKMSDGELAQLMQRYDLALIKIMQSNEVGSFYSSWIAYIDSKKSEYFSQQRKFPNETLLATIIINNLQILYYSFPKGSLIRTAIENITYEGYKSDELFNKLIVSKELE